MAAKKTPPPPPVSKSIAKGGSASKKTTVKPKKKSAPVVLARGMAAPSGKTVDAKKAPAKKAPAKKVSGKKVSGSKISGKVSENKISSKAGTQKAPAVSSKAKAVEPIASVANSLSAAAKRIQEREERRKQRTAERIAASRPNPKTNGHKAPHRPARPAKPLSAKDLQKFKALLLEFRDRIVGDIQFLTADNLHRMGRETGADLSGASQHSADHGTDNFDREFALSLATTEQDVIYEVDEALMRIEEGTYGFCEMTGVAIEKARLEVIPYTRFSVQAQARMEQGRAKYRPFAQAFKSW